MVKITQDLSQPIEGAHVLVVEDIIDTGLTMAYLLENLATRNPASREGLRPAQKPSRARRKVPIDHVGFVIPDQFVVGYGLDYDERYRNLPFMGVLKKTMLAMPWRTGIRDPWRRRIPTAARPCGAS